MSLVLYGQTGPEPAPEPPPEPGRRRYLIILGMVVLLILGGGSAAYLLLSSSVPASPRSSGGYPPPVVDPTTVAASDAASASADASPAASAPASASPSVSPPASHAPTPGRTPTPKPTGAGAPPPAGPYRLPSGQLCPAMDFTTIAQTAGAPAVSSGRGADPVDFSCAGGFGPTQKVQVQADAFIFPSAGAAEARFTTDSAGGDHVTGVGSDASGTIPDIGGFTLFVLDANLELEIHLIGVGGTPVPSTLRQWAIDSARGTLPHLRA
jgi:hypothetical protein